MMDQPETPASRPEMPSIGSMAQAMYQELRRLASAKLARVPAGHTLNTTSLVHEAYLRLLGKQPLKYANDREFFLIAACAMRDILVERARKSASLKAGGNRRQLDFDSLSLAIDLDPIHLLCFDEVLKQVKQEDEIDHDMIMLRFYSGLTEAQTAEALALPLRSLQRRWQYLRVKLYRRLAAFNESEAK